MHRQIGNLNVHGPLLNGNQGNPGYVPGGFIMDDDFIMGTDLGDHMNDEEAPIVDEVEVLNPDRLLLVKIHTTMIKLAIDEYQT